MWIEALEPLSVRLPTGSVPLDPGRPVELAGDVAVNLLQRAPEKVRRLVVLEPEALVPGTRVLWQSPVVRALHRRGGAGPGARVGGRERAFYYGEAGPRAGQAGVGWGVELEDFTLLPLYAKRRECRHPRHRRHEVPHTTPDFTRLRRCPLQSGGRHWPSCPSYDAMPVDAPRAAERSSGLKQPVHNHHSQSSQALPRGAYEGAKT